MTTLEAQLAELADRLEEINKQTRACSIKHDEIAAALKVRGAENVWPQSGDKYWFISSNLSYSTALMSTTFSADEFDIHRQSIGNFFRTRPEAEAQLDAMKVVVELRACEGAKAFVVDEDNYCLTVQLKREVVEYQWWRDSDRGWQSIYLETAAHVHAAIAKVGEARIVKAATWLAMRKVEE